MATRTEMTNDKFKCMVWDDRSILDTLQHEAIELKDKIENARNRGDFGTYKNLILAFKEIINLIHEEKEKTEWKDMFSHYKMEIDGEFQDVVSTWRQRGEDIEDHKVYKIEKEITNNPTYDLYFDVSNNDKGEKTYMISYKGEIHNLIGFDVNYIAEYIKKLCDGTETKIYGDLTCFGIAVADRLTNLGCKVNDTTINSANVTRNGGAIQQRKLSCNR